ncbi:PREDICTED: non-specific lipid-transfer protein 11-like [Tarenaya hassleriana]|uniref:non-specific lipid-transfer protein 11-like n=1 Tax=Tarenaya hassleriana TaxID=28532 RepID=UPI00053C2CED|nr:PREDICTED: non-specific lipid-transfer protein 11-like [Tarenaya hassleriana]XP_010527036.1 PREDICTED: non-specific lipid-transfer protein 11-like [Tarenaya hassleriana]
MRKLVVLPLLVIVFVSMMAEEGKAITCSQANLSMAPCLSYLMNGGNPSALCCKGMKNLKKATPEKDDRQTVCRCLKDTATKNPKIKDDNASQLPGKCGVDFGVPFSTGTNCDSVN